MDLVPKHPRHVKQCRRRRLQLLVREEEQMGKRRAEVGAVNCSSSITTTATRNVSRDQCGEVKPTRRTRRIIILACRCVQVTAFGAVHLHLGLLPLIVQTSLSDEKHNTNLLNQTVSLNGLTWTNGTHRYDRLAIAQSARTDTKVTLPVLFHLLTTITSITVRRARHSKHHTIYLTMASSPCDVIM